MMIYLILGLVIFLGVLLALAGLRTWLRLTLIVLPVMALAFGAATRWLLT